MAKILSQDEVDALLSEYSDDDQEQKPVEPQASKSIRDTSAAEKSKKVSLYNFRRPDRISKEQLRSLHYLHDRFARNFSSSLSAYLRALIDVSLYSVEQFTYAEFVLSLPDPTYFNAIEMNPLEGSAVLEINPKILFPMIDKILGGKGEDFGGGGIRTITDIERELIEGVLHLILKDLEASWEQIIKLNLRIEATETSPQLIQVVAPNEIVVLIVFEIKVGDSKGFMNFCIPSIVIEPIVNRFSQDWYADRAKTNTEELHKLKLNITKTLMNVDVGITGNKIFVKQLMNLRKGDLLTLETKEDKPFSIMINDKKKMSGYQANVGKKKYIQIENIFKREY
jgi:flagellar motor switch protein FliM